MKILIFCVITQERIEPAVAGFETVAQRLLQYSGNVIILIMRNT